jgi:hypothetical protein
MEVFIDKTAPTIEPINNGAVWVKLTEQAVAEPRCTDDLELDGQRTKHRHGRLTGG